MVILITTSRRPARRIRTFCHDLACSIPNAIRVNRGKMNLDGIAEKALIINARRVVIVSRWKGGPGKIEFFKIDSARGLTPIPPVFYVAGIKLQREFDIKPWPIHSLTITTPLKVPYQIMKIAQSLSTFLKIPTLSITNSTSHHHVSIHVSSVNFNHTQITFTLLPQAVEVGPRITVSKVIWDI